MANLNITGNLTQNNGEDIQTQITTLKGSKLSSVTITSGAVYTNMSGTSGTNTSVNVTIPSGAIVTGISVTHYAGTQYGNGTIWGLKDYSVSGTTVTVNITRNTNDGSPYSRIAVFYILISQSKA